jgi:hypothetical protein
MGTSSFGTKSMRRCNSENSPATRWVGRRPRASSRRGRAVTNVQHRAPWRPPINAGTDRNGLVVLDLRHRAVVVQVL